MAINTALLVAAPILQDYFSDNATDAAMSNGVITCYQDNSRTTLKNWYYQSGTPGAYTYVPLNNPLTLSAAGTITDPNGNDTIPFWYPYSETDNVTPQPYYVTVDNSNGQRQFTRQNFPFVPPANTSGLTSTLRNLIVNNVFWRNPGSVNLTNNSGIICPSQHDGFIGNMADIQFFKNAAGATDTATFNKFANINRLNGDATPEFYLNMSSGNSGTSETVKYIQIPICLHVDNLSGYTNASVTLWTQNVGGSANNTLTINLFQFLGTGVTSPAATTLATINPSSTWQKTIVAFSFPQATLPPGGPGDDGWFLQIGLPLGVPYNMNIAKPSVYLSEVVPSDDFDTYEFVSSTIDSPRTGDIRTSLNTYYPYGWVPLNGGSIGNASSNASARANNDAWPLFNLIWNAFQNFSTGTPSSGTNPLAQMQTSSGTNVGYGKNVTPNTTAIQDWNNNNQLILTNTMSKVLLGTVPFSALLATQNNTFTATNVGGNIKVTPLAPLLFFTGMPVYFTNTGGALPTGLSSNTIYYASSFNSGDGSFFVSTSFNNALAGTVISFTDAGSGTNSVVGAITGSFEGEFAHTLLRNELPDPVTTTAHTAVVAAGADKTVIESSTSYAGGQVSNQGGNTPHNITQPGYFMNMFMKL